MTRSTALITVPDEIFADLNEFLDTYV